MSARGHERVLRARLSDARFFYTEDQKKSLDAMTERLQGVIFQAQLGTSFEKVKRFQELALFITDKLSAQSIGARLIARPICARLTWCRKWWANSPSCRASWAVNTRALPVKTAEVAEAIFEHYLPRFAEDSIPFSDIGAIVGIADKLDTIAGCFGVGLIPTGTADPYALRRQCLGIINIITGRQHKISLAGAVKKAIALLKEKLKRPADEVLRNDVSISFPCVLQTCLHPRGILLTLLMPSYHAG